MKKEKKQKKNDTKMLKICKKMLNVQVPGIRDMQRRWVVINNFLKKNDMEIQISKEFEKTLY